MMTFTKSQIANLVRSRKPGYSLEQPFYTDPSIYDADMEGIFYRQWLFVLPSCALEKTGDFQRTKIGAYDIIILKDGEGNIRSFHNSCRHRGSIICNSEKGRKAKLTCPYHQWTYGLDGTLQWANDVGENFDKAELGLKKVHCREVEGMVFVCLADEAPDFDTFANTVRPYLAVHDLANAKVAQQTTIVEKGNWKLVWENNRECYHCAGNHPDLTLTYSADPAVTGITTDGKFPELVENHFNRMENEKIPSRFQISDDGKYRVARMPLLGDAESYTINKKAAVKKPLGSIPFADGGALVMFNYPTTWNHFLPDHSITFRVNPIGPKETEVTTTWLVHKDAVEGVDYDLENLVRVWTNTNDEDRRVVEENQQGIDTPAYQPGPYSTSHEDGVMQFVDWYLNQLSASLETLKNAAE